jgi:hypothetical protein
MGKGNQGINSKNVRHTTAPKAEPKAYAKNLGGVSQLGNKVGSHVTNKGDTGYRGDSILAGGGYSPPGMISDPVKCVGVGGGRTIHSSGSQGTHGATNPGKPGLPSTRGQRPDSR